LSDHPRGHAGSIGQIVLAAIARFEDRPALADDHGSLTYREFAQGLGRATAVFESLGLQAGEGIAILSGNRIELLVCQFAAMLMGLRYTALHPLAAESNHRFILEDAEIAALILDPRVIHGTIGFIHGVGSLRHVLSFGPFSGAVDLLDMMSRAAPRVLEDKADPDAIAYLYYTGGTTGRPKGVMLPHRSIVMATILQAADWDLPSGEIRFLATTPASHASGIIVPTIFLRGGFVRLTTGFDPQRFCEIVAAEKINMTFLVPTMLYGLLDSPSVHRHDLSSLQTVMYGAAPISAERLVQAIGYFGRIFVQLYGQTEMPMCIATLRKVDHDLGRPERIASCGLPVASLQVKLFDAAMTEVGIGESGEICVRGTLAMDGYWKSPQATEEAFAGGWLHTGDVAKRTADGYLTLVDRTKDLIISGGFNVYPREVEDALLAHADVAGAAVIGVPDAKWGEAVIAYVVRRERTAIDGSTLKAHVKAVRGAIWSPKEILFVDELPLTAVGKVDRKALRLRHSRREEA
jgi:fatty-acyl-CoA synthase